MISIPLQRFSGNLNDDLRKMSVNLVPFPRLHFLAIVQAPLFAPADGKHARVTTQEITDQIWSSRNFLANITPEDGKCLAVSCAYGGNLATQEVDDEIAKVQQRMSDNFVTLIPNNIKSSTITVPAEDSPISGVNTFVANNTALKSVFQRKAAQFAQLYNRKLSCIDVKVKV